MTSYLRNSPQSGLSDSDILDIRSAAQSGQSAERIGADYGIDRTTAGRIINGTTWSHVPSPKRVGNYSVYPDGRVFSKAAGRFLTTAKGADGLVYVELRSDGRRERVAVATLVAKAFLGSKASTGRLRFVNGNTLDAHFTNLSITK